MSGTMKCDICGKVIKLQPTVKYKIEKDGLLVLCKKCWQKQGKKRSRFHGQIQGNYYLATN